MTTLKDSSNTAAPETLVLDAPTLRDLEVFESSTAELSLYRLCNQTRTDGGARVLRRRMANPWAAAENIKATQQAVTYVTNNRSAFSKMPSAYSANRVDHYTHEVLPIVLHEHWFEFGIGALSLWANHDRHYTAIAVGVQMTCGFMRSLRAFVSEVVLTSEAGELNSLFKEITELLDSPNLAAVPNKQVGGSPFRIVRLDQIFRLHEKSTIARLQELLHEVDAIVSMADVTQEHGFVMPSILSGGLRVEAEDLVHPFVEHAVANPVAIDQSARVLFLTGPNMAGKTTYLRAFATALYFAHLGMGVPAKSFGFVPAQRLFSSLSLTDDLHGGVSYFRAEALRVKAIAQAVAEGYRVVALMDEPFKGTNVKDALDASRAMLERFSVREDCLFMFSSHLIELSDQLDSTSQIDCRYFEADEGQGKLRFDYLLRKGISTQRLGMRVLREEGVFELLD